MQKKLIALAIAGLSGAAFAQSNVTVYGVADADFESVSATGGTQNAAATMTGINQPRLNRVSTNSSHIGFKGSEALGNGMTAVFQVENGVNLDNAAAGAWNNRDTFVGLAGGFGTVAMGHLTGPYRAAVASFEMVPGATGAPSAVMNLAGKALTNVGGVRTAAASDATATTHLAASYFSSTGITTATATRVQNTIAYISPTMGGFNAVIAHSTGPLAAEGKTVEPVAAAGTSTANAKAWTVGLNYDNGPLKAKFAWQSIKDAAILFAEDYTVSAAGETGDGASNNRSANSKIDSWILGAGYTFGSTTVNLAYDVNKAKASGSQAAGAAIPAVAANSFRVNDTKQKAWIISGKHVFGANEIAAEYVRTRSTVNGSYGAASTNVFRGLNDQGATSVTLRFGHNLSKRTQAYAFYTQINNQENGRYDFTTNAALGGTTGNGQDPRAIGAGLRHSF